MVKEATIFWTCKYCGQDTSHVEADYLSGYNHLSCALKYEVETASTKNTPAECLLVPFDLVYSTPNDQYLGEKIRRMYYAAKDNC